MMIIPRIVIAGIPPYQQIESPLKDIASRTVSGSTHFRTSFAKKTIFSSEECLTRKELVGKLLEVISDCLKNSILIS